MSPHLCLNVAEIYFVHSLVAIIAPSIFLTYYIAYIMAEVKSCKRIEAIPLPWWMNFQYPSWLDRISVQGIVKAFFRALGLAIVSVIGLGIIFIVLVGKGMVR
jgi:hypothetical protein